MIVIFALFVSYVLLQQFRFRKGSGEIFSEGSSDLPRGRGAAAGWNVEVEGDGQDIFIFGGFSNTKDDRMNTFAMNDFWKYVVKSNSWTLLAGNQTEADGNSLGAYTGTTYPGSRYGAVTYPYETFLYLYGGKVVLADVWKYDVGTGAWTIVKDEQNDQVVGTDSHPGAKYMATVFIFDTKTVYLFGGSTYESASIYGFTNDVWKISDGETFQHQWGTKKAFELGTYEGTISPPAMYGAAGWVNGGKLYMFGGRGLRTGGSTTNPGESDLTYFNNLFSYAPGSKRWDFLGGEEDADNHPGYGDNDIQLELGPKPVCSNASVFSDDNWPGARAFHQTFGNGAELWMVGGIGLETFPDATTNGKPFSSVWLYSVSKKQWRTHEKWVFPDGEGGISTTDDSFHDDNYPGCKHLANIFKVTGKSVYMLFGWGADKRNVKYGAYYDTLMATTDEVWELSVTNVGGGANGAAIAAAIILPLLAVCALAIIIVVVVVVVVILVKRKQGGDDYNEKELTTE